MTTTQRLKRQSGFTLIELIVVLAIVGMLASIAVPRISNSDATLAAQAHRLARDLRHTQAMAMNQGRRLTFAIQSISAYKVIAGGSTVLDPATQQRFSITLDNDITLSGTDTEFDSLGRPVAGVNLLDVDRVFILAGNSRKAIVTLSPVTGFVTVTP